MKKCFTSVPPCATEWSDRFLESAVDASMFHVTHAYAVHGHRRIRLLRRLRVSAAGGHAGRFLPVLRR